jgi:hypothetical protein
MIVVADLGLAHPREKFLVLAFSTIALWIATDRLWRTTRDTFSHAKELPSGNPAKCRLPSPLPPGPLT